MSIFLSNYLLASQGDRVAMANSVEIRVPFLDFRLIEFMARVPAKWKILGLKEKYALKRAVSSYLPRSIVGRAKHPYRAPIARSLLGSGGGELAREMLSRGSIRRVGLFDPAGVAMLLRKCEVPERAGERDNMALMGVLSTQLLDRLFVTDFQREPRDPHAETLVVDRRST
jgi:asparagine synthase (glutamine-hydrolysing)